LKFAVPLEFHSPVYSMFGAYAACNLVAGNRMAWSLIKAG